MEEGKARTIVAYRYKNDPRTDILYYMKPFLQKWSTVPDDYEKLYQRMVRDLNEPDCTTTWNILTAWGNKP